MSRVGSGRCSESVQGARYARESGSSHDMQSWSHASFDLSMAMPVVLENWPSSDFHLDAEPICPHGSRLAPSDKGVSELKPGSVHRASHLTCYNVRRTGPDRYLESTMGYLLLVYTNEKGGTKAGTWLPEHLTSTAWTHGISGFTIVRPPMRSDRETITQG